MIKFIKAYLKQKKIDKLKSSVTPWIEIKSEKLESNGNISLTMDWNDAFIKELRNAGYKGIRDDEVIDHYLYALFRNAEMKYTFADKEKEDL